MIGRFTFALLLFFLVASCSMSKRANLPEIAPLPDGRGSGHSLPAIFPVGRWQLVHSIAFHLADGSRGSAIGVLIIDGKQIRCALTTVEGLTLFEAESVSGKPPKVSRAVPPFDKKGFAAGLMNDVQTIFQLPSGQVEYGRLKNGKPVYRYAGISKTTDILPQTDGCWTMKTYADRIVTRTVHARSCKTIDSTVLPEDITMVAAGPAGYSLKLHLIRAEKLPTKN